MYIVLNTSEPETSLRFALRLPVFEVQAILRQVHRMTPNDLDHYEDSDTPYMYMPYQ